MKDRVTFSTFQFCLVGIAYALFGASCGTHQLLVQTEPEGAEIFLSSDGSSPVKVGVSPMAISGDDLKKFDTGLLKIQLQKPGFYPDFWAIQLPRSTAQVRVFHRMRENKEFNACSKQDESVNEVGRGVAAVQSRIMKKKTADASIQLAILLAKFPNVGILHDLAGHIAFLQQDYRKALEHYQKSKSLTPPPGNIETIQMIERVEKLLGGRGVSSSMPSQATSTSAPSPRGAP